MSSHTQHTQVSKTYYYDVIGNIYQYSCSTIHKTIIKHTYTDITYKSPHSLNDMPEITNVLHCIILDDLLRHYQSPIDYFIHIRYDNNTLIIDSTHSMINCGDVFIFIIRFPNTQIIIPYVDYSFGKLVKYINGTI